MAEILIDRISAQKNANIDVLFIAGISRIPAQIPKLLDEKDLNWAKTTLTEFLKNCNNLPIIGTVLVDTVEIPATDSEDLCQAIARLEQKNIATVLLNNYIDLPFKRFHLASLVQSASLEEMWGRIEANLIHHNNLSENKGAQIGDAQANHDLKNYQLAGDTAEQLKMAGQVQRSFLPSTLPDNNFVQWATIFQPADWVSGDIYDITRLDEQHIGFYLADAVGHSVPAALLTMFLKQAITMRETKGNDYRIFSPEEVITDLNNKMVAQNLTGCLFATCCYCLLNFKDLQLTYSRAGHPYPILIRRGEKPRQLENRGGLLGIFEDAQFTQETIQLESGDKLFLYSDGIESLIGKCNDQSEFIFTPEFLSNES